MTLKQPDEKLAARFPGLINESDTIVQDMLSDARRVSLNAGDCADIAACER